MTEPQQAFLELCTQLRLLGAVKVQAGDLSAEFSPSVRVSQQTAAAPPEKDEKPMSAEEARELAYARELGRA